MKSLIFAYGIASYLIGVAGLLAIIFHMVGLVSFQPGPFELDGVVSNFFLGFSLVALFGVQHTIMARASFKTWWTRYIPAAAERSTFVLITGLISLAMMYLWPSMPTILWQITDSTLANVVTTVGVLGWAYLFLATFAIDHFELFGLQQVFRNLKGAEPKQVAFKERFMYRFDRHPIMTGALVGFWATPVMTMDHLLFSALMTIYVIIGVSVEERSLVAHLGKTYNTYRDRVRTIVPTFRWH